MARLGQSISIVPAILAVLTGPQQHSPFRDDAALKPPTLSYAQSHAKRRTQQRWRGWWIVDLVSVPSTSESRKWWGWRLIYYLALLALFAVIAFQFGPNLINFGKLTRLSVVDFVPIVQQQCVPIVKAAKEYQRDHGHLPNSREDLVPTYLPTANFPGSIDQSQFQYFSMWNHMITCDFTPGIEGWSISGPFVRGPIPLPPVTIGPAKLPASQLGQ